jgi:hypothetical protein
MYLVKALADNQIEFSQSIAELLATCTSCGACDSRCGIIRSQAPYVNPLDIIRLVEALRGSYQKESRKISGDKRPETGQRKPFKLSQNPSDKASTVFFSRFPQIRPGWLNHTNLMEKIEPSHCFCEKVLVLRRRLELGSASCW